MTIATIKEPVVPLEGMGAGGVFSIPWGPPGVAAANYFLTCASLSCWLDRLNDFILSHQMD